MRGTEQTQHPLQKYGQNIKQKKGGLLEKKLSPSSRNQMVQKSYTNLKNSQSQNSFAPFASPSALWGNENRFVSNVSIRQYQESPSHAILDTGKSPNVQPPILPAAM